MLRAPYQPDWGEYGNVWDAFRLTCDPRASARRLFSSFRNTFLPQSYHSANVPDPVSPSSEDFNFVTSTAGTTTNFCHIPWARYTQGHFFSDWRTISALYPLFSPAKAAGFLDVRIPSHYYYNTSSEFTYGWDPKRVD